MIRVQYLKKYRLSSGFSSFLWLLKMLGKKDSLDLLLLLILENPEPSFISMTFNHICFKGNNNNNSHSMPCIPLLPSDIP